MSKLYVNEVHSKTGSTKALEIDSSGNIEAVGRITAPANPAFRVQRTSNVAANNTVVYDTKKFDVGNNFNTSTGTFTAPIDGVYFFGGFAWGGTNEADIVLQFRVNGTVVERVTMQGSVQSGQEIGSSFNVLLQLNEDDEVTVFTGRALRGTAGYNYFNGYLVG